MSPVFPCTNASLAVTPASTEGLELVRCRWCQMGSRNNVPSMRWAFACASTLGFRRWPQVLFCALLSDLGRLCGVDHAPTRAPAQKAIAYLFKSRSVATFGLPPEHACPRLLTAALLAANS